MLTMMKKERTAAVSCEFLSRVLCHLMDAGSVDVDKGKNHQWRKFSRKLRLSTKLGKPRYTCSARSDSKYFSFAFKKAIFFNVYVRFVPWRIFFSGQENKKTKNKNRTLRRYKFLIMKKLFIVQNYIDASDSTSAS